MSKIRITISNLLNEEKPEVFQDKDYGLSDMNWQDDGGSPHDPSMNDYLKGYQMEPYEFKQYAEKNILHKIEAGESIGSISVVANKSTSELYELNGFSRETIATSKLLKPGSYIIVDRVSISQEERELRAAKETRDVSYTPDNLAKEIVTLWKQVDGTLQNFYDGFTMNKMNNKMKKEIAEIINSWGYDVTPTFTQETPIYANAYGKFKKIASLNPINVTAGFAELFPDSKGLAQLKKELEYLAAVEGVKVTTAEAGGLVDYYKQIFPNDYAMELVSVAFDNPKLSFDDFKDIQISDEALTQMEKMDSGNQKPTSDKPNNGGMGGYDFTTQTRSDGPGGVAPSSYETRANRIKKK